MDRLREQCADVAVLSHFLPPLRVELVKENTNGRSRSVGKCSDKGRSRLVLTNEFRHSRGTFTGELHREALPGVLGESLLDLERCFQAVASRVDRPSLR